jgi:putative FmdB family regulatory protein
MPIYEFVCQHCGNEFEKILSFSAQTTPHCPKCNSQNVERRVGRPAIHFKGSGWYITDSKASKDSSNGSSAKTTEKTESADSTADTSAKSETKSETKSESKSESKSEAKSEPA